MPKKRIKVSCKITIGEIVGSSSRKKVRFLKLYNVSARYNIVNYNVLDVSVTLK